MSTQNPFQKASRSQVFLKLAITGPTGSGKTYSALRLAMGLVADTGKRVAFLDTENDSASLYSDDFDFDVLPIAPPFEAQCFAGGIASAVAADYGVAIIDSASHFWKGILSYKDKLDKRGGNSFTNWGEADKPFDAFMDAVLQSKIHLIFCMRSKMEFVLEDNGKGKQAPKRVGLAPVFRDGIEFEFTTVFDVAADHNAQASKDRSKLFRDRIFQIDEETGKQFAAWLKTAKPKPEAPPELTPEDERQKRIAGRIAAAEKDGVPLETYVASACHLNGTEAKSLSDFTTDELKSTTKNHATIISAIKAHLEGAK